MSSKVEHFADVPGGYLYYQTSGQGQDVVLFNGGTADLRMWDTTTAWLAQIARVTTFDYRDTGPAWQEMLTKFTEIDRVLVAEGVRAAAEVDLDAWGPAEITTPVSVLLGGRDFQGTALWARRLANQAPSATLTVIPDADHFPMLSTPQEFERILREVLQSAPAATAPSGSSTI
jgi:pimeloyl-ACP methyl ester carboxylesterase